MDQESLVSVLTNCDRRHPPLLGTSLSSVTSTQTDFAHTFSGPIWLKPRRPHQSFEDRKAFLLKIIDEAISIVDEMKEFENALGDGPVKQ